MLSLATASFYLANFAEGADIITLRCRIRNENMSIEKEKEKEGARRREVLKRTEEYISRESTLEEETKY